MLETEATKETQMDVHVIERPLGGFAYQVKVPGLNRPQTIILTEDELWELVSALTEASAKANGRG